MPITYQYNLTKSNAEPEFTPGAIYENNMTGARYTYVKNSTGGDVTAGYVYNIDSSFALVAAASGVATRRSGCVIATSLTSGYYGWVQTSGPSTTAICTTGSSVTAGTCLRFDVANAEFDDTDSALGAAVADITLSDTHQKHAVANADIGVITAAAASVTLYLE